MVTLKLQIAPMAVARGEKSPRLPATWRIRTASICILHAMHHLLNVHLELSSFLHLQHNVAPTQQLALNVHLHGTAYPRVRSPDSGAVVI